MAEDDDNVECVINKWVMEYILHLAWKEFKESHTLKKYTIELLTGWCGINFSCGGGFHTEQKLLMDIMLQIVDGQNINEQCADSSEVESEEEVTKMPLENVLTHFTNLVDQQSDKHVIDLGKELSFLIKTEAVLACCRVENFTQAMAVFNRHFSDFDKTHSYYSKVQDLWTRVQTKQKASKTYDVFVETIILYIDKIFMKYSKPSLIQAANSLLQGQDDQSLVLSLKGSHKRFHRDVLEKSEEASSKNGDHSSQEQRLRALWDANIRELFGGLSAKQTKGSEAKSANLEASNASNAPQSCTVSSTQSRSKKLRSNNFACNEIDIQTSSPVKPGCNPFQSLNICVSPVQRYCQSEGHRDRHKPVQRELLAKGKGMDTSRVTSSMCGERHKKWTEDETAEFYHAVDIIGVGQWAKIKEYLGTERTQVMLKDRWRTMLKNGAAEKLSAIRK